MRSYAILALALAAVAVSVYAETITVNVKHGSVEKKIELDAETSDGFDIINQFKQQTGVKGNLKLHYASGKELNEEHLIKETQIKNGDTLTLS